ncbi:MAG: ATP-binding protein [Nitrospirota bacterium]
MTHYHQREITPLILEALSNMPVVVISGMRQTGKSTFIQRQPEIRKRKYVTFDDFSYLQAAKEDPDSFVESEVPLAIDEAQKCPDLLIAIKKRVDRMRRPGQFLLSGSANFSMLKNISESLAGRAIYFNMRPFTIREIKKKISGLPFLYNFFNTLKIPGTIKAAPIKNEDILTGGMPSVCLNETKNRLLWFKGYEQTYLERDVRQISQIGNIIPFRQLLQLTAMRTGQILSLSQLGRDAKLNVATTSRHLSILEASFITNRINPYLKNRASRLIKSPKLYISDSGLACYLAGIKSLESEQIKGAMLETYVAQNLCGIIDSAWPEAQLYFWNVQGRYEVDFIVEAGNRCLAIEVKSGARWDNRDLSGLKAFLQATPHCIGAVLACNVRETVKLGKRIWAIPISVLLS